MAAQSRGVWARANAIGELRDTMGRMLRLTIVTVLPEEREVSVVTLSIELQNILKSDPKQ
jgi:hypothetical protein